MYFPDDPLFFQDPIFNSIPDPAARAAPRRPLRPRRHRAGVGARVPRSTSSCAVAAPTPFEEDRPWLSELGAAGSRRRRRSGRSCTSPCLTRRCRTPSPRTRRARSGCAARVARRRRRSRSRTPSSRRGRPIRTGASTTPTIPAARAASPPGFRGFGRCPTDDAGRWAIRTVKPGAVPAPDGAAEAPHLAVSVFARGLLDRVVTRVYFGDEADANAADPLLVDAARPRPGTLVAQPDRGRLPLRHPSARGG